MLNADHAELEKFGELAHRWWDANSEFKPLHDINPLRLGWIDRCTHLRGKQVLDVGCGGGLLCAGGAGDGRLRAAEQEGRVGLVAAGPRRRGAGGQG